MIVTTMVKLFAAMLLGLYLGKKGVLDSSTNKKMSSVIVNVTGPALVINSVTSLEGTDPKAVIGILIYGIVIYCLLPFIGWAVAKMLRVDKDLVGTYILTILLCNNSFMGFPVVQAFLGDKAIFYTSILHFGFNIMFYALGLSLIRKDAGDTSNEGIKIRDLINTGTIAAIVVIIIFFGRLSIPTVVAEPFGFVGSMTMPLSMMIIGANMAQYKLKTIFYSRRMYVITAIRLFVIPALIYVTANMFLKDTYSVQVATLTFGMPCAALVAMGTAPYKKQGKVGAVAVAFTTICSMISIPIWAVLLGI